MLPQALFPSRNNHLPKANLLEVALLPAKTGFSTDSFAIKTAHLGVLLCVCKDLEPPLVCRESRMLPGRPTEAAGLLEGEAAEWGRCPPNLGILMGCPSSSMMPAERFQERKLVGMSSL